MTEEDALAIGTYLLSLPPRHTAHLPTAVYLSWRGVEAGTCSTSAGNLRSDPARDEVWNRYLARHLGHCGGAIRRVAAWEAQTAAVNWPAHRPETAAKTFPTSRRTATRV